MLQFLRESGILVEALSSYPGLCEPCDGLGYFIQVSDFVVPEHMKLPHTPLHLCQELLSETPRLHGPIVRKVQPSSQFARHERPGLWEAAATHATSLEGVGIRTGVVARTPCNPIAHRK